MNRPLAQIMNARGVSRLEVAFVSRCDPKTVRKIEKLDVATLKLDSVMRVAQALHVAPSDLIPALGVPPRRERRVERSVEWFRQRRAHPDRAPSWALE